MGPVTRSVPDEQLDEFVEQYMQPGPRKLRGPGFFLCLAPVPGISSSPS